MKRGHESLYHLTKGMGYYYDRTMGSGVKGVLGRNSRGSIKTRSGVVGSRYSSQISRSPFLTEDEKAEFVSDFGKSIAELQQESTAIWHDPEQLWNRGM